MRLYAHKFKVSGISLRQPWSLCKCRRASASSAALGREVSCDEAAANVSTLLAVVPLHLCRPYREIRSSQSPSSPPVAACGKTTRHQLQCEFSSAFCDDNFAATQELTLQCLGCRAPCLTNFLMLQISLLRISSLATNPAALQQLHRGLLGLQVGSASTSSLWQRYRSPFLCALPICRTQEGVTPEASQSVVDAYCFLCLMLRCLQAPLQDTLTHRKGCFLRPHRVWWMSAALIILAQMCFLQATPTSAR